MKTFILLTLFVSLSACSSVGFKKSKENQVLDIPRIAQETPMWCWLATSEMALKSQPGSCAPDLSPFYQGSMIRYMLWAGFLDPMMHGRCMYDPKLCPFPAFDMINFKIVIDMFSKDGSRNEGCGPAQTMSGENWSSSKEKIQSEIGAKRPIIAGVNLDGVPRIQTAQHAVIIIGYDPATEIVTLNDPFNYEPGQDPWPALGASMINEGQYEIAYDNLAHKALWRTSLYISEHKPEE